MKIFKKSTFYVLAIFLLGLATGGVIGLTVAKRQISKPVEFKTIARVVKKELSVKLDLDEAQKKKIDPMVDRSVERIQVIYYDTLERIDDVLLDSQKSLVSDLRPEQLAKMDSLAKSRKDFIRKHNPLELRK